LTFPLPPAAVKNGDGACSRDYVLIPGGVGESDSAQSTFARWDIWLNYSLINLRWISKGSLLRHRLGRLRGHHAGRHHVLQRAQRRHEWVPALQVNTLEHETRQTWTHKVSNDPSCWAWSPTEPSWTRAGPAARTWPTGVSYSTSPNCRARQWDKVLYTQNISFTGKHLLDRGYFICFVYNYCLLFPQVFLPLSFFAWWQTARRAPARASVAKIGPTGVSRSSTSNYLALPEANWSFLTRIMCCYHIDNGKISE